LSASAITDGRSQKDTAVLALSEAKNESYSTAWNSVHYATGLTAGK